jgi:BirA family biotin operon repressor/biotin-[acetyl-CoA-carboxylase] ligase
MNIESLRQALPGRRIEYFESIDSTMRAAALLPMGAVVVANEQTAGQGRHGHSWHSEPGSGIYVSLVLEPTPLLTLALGLAAADAIATCCGLVCDIRWPNDLMLGGKKCGGILAQLVEGRAVGGIGINVNHTHFPGELAEQATSLRVENGRVGEPTAPLEREALLAALLRAIDQTVGLPAGQILDRFTAASSYASGLRVVVDQPGGVVRGVTAGLDPSGFLKVRQDNGTVTLILAGGVRAARS